MCELIKTEDLRLGNWVKSKIHDGLETEVFSILSHQKLKIGCGLGQE